MPVIDGEEFELPPGVTLADEGALRSAARRYAMSARIGAAALELGPGATRKAIAERAGVTVSRYLGPSRAAPDPEGVPVTTRARRVRRARSGSGWHPDQQRLGLRVGASAWRALAFLWHTGPSTNVLPRKRLGRKRAAGYGCFSLGRRSRDP